MCILHRSLYQGHIILSIYMRILHRPLYQDHITLSIYICNPHRPLCQWHGYSMIILQQGINFDQYTGVLYIYLYIRGTLSIHRGMPHTPYIRGITLWQSTGAIHSDLYLRTQLFLNFVLLFSTVIQFAWRVWFIQLCFTVFTFINEYFSNLN